MAISDHVVSLELSKKLKELGVLQRSEFRWFEYAGNKGWRLVRNYREFWQNSYISAFLASELGEMLPKSIKVKDKVLWLQIEVQGVQDGWACQYRNLAEKFGFTHKFFEDKNMVNAMAQMLIYLKENGLVDPKEKA